jgi:hypothetical protein
VDITENVEVEIRKLLGEWSSNSDEMKPNLMQMLCPCFQIQTFVFTKIKPIFELFMLRLYLIL